jgi:hypothetical protein
MAIVVVKAMLLLLVVAILLRPIELSGAGR